MSRIITRRDFLATSAAAAAASVPLALRGADAPSSQAKRRPNIVFILADDLGYGDVGCFGQKLIKTPNLDRMAAGGTRFTESYCGTSVCAPSRCALMTGLHMGHAPIRGNRELKDAGYDTACIGKWGLGFWGSTGDPNKIGFDYFYGYNCQRKAHEYYPAYLWRNAEKVPLDGKTYSPDLMTQEALTWLKQRKDKPFFLYLPFTLPHPKLQAPDLGEYKDKDWTDQEKAYAAMVTRLDRDVGTVLDALKAQGLDENTIVFFASDNGPNLNKRFNSSGGLSGIKRGMLEGSLRSPTIVRWPGHVPAGRTCDEPWALWDLLPTCAEFAGATLPARLQIDGISVAPALLGKKMPAREYFYWELHEGMPKQAVRFGSYKAIRNKPGGPLAVFDLSRDPAEKEDLAARLPDVAAKAETYLQKARTDSPDWPWKAKAGEEP